MSGKNANGEKIPSPVLQHLLRCVKFKRIIKKKKNLPLQGNNFEKEQSNEHFAEYDTVPGIYSMTE